MVRRVRRQVGCGVAGQWTASAAPSLIEDDGPVAGGIEVPAAIRRRWPTGPAVQPDARETVGRDDRLPVHGVTIPHMQVAGLVRLDRGMHDRESCQKGYRHSMLPPRRY